MALAFFKTLLRRRTSIAPVKTTPIQPFAAVIHPIHHNKAQVVPLPPSEPSREICSICLDPITSSCSTLECHHKFCETCIADWGRKSNLCPCCRAPTVPHTPPQTPQAPQIPGSEIDLQPPTQPAPQTNSLFAHSPTQRRPQLLEPLDPSHMQVIQTLMNTLNTLEVITREVDRQQNNTEEIINNLESLTREINRRNPQNNIPTAPPLPPDYVIYYRRGHLPPIAVHITERPDWAT